jgi:DNA invertase Pin-like site-specific DNA recombinase
MDSNAAEVCERLNRMARRLGRTLGIEIGVDESGDRLVFVDDDGDPISDDGDIMVAATAEEIAGKTFLREFAARAGRASAVAKWQEIERSRTP